MPLRAASAYERARSALSERRNLTLPHPRRAARAGSCSAASTLQDPMPHRPIRLLAHPSVLLIVRCCARSLCAAGSSEAALLQSPNATAAQYRLLLEAPGLPAMMRSEPDAMSMQVEAPPRAPVVPTQRPNSPSPVANGNSQEAQRARELLRVSASLHASWRQRRASLSTEGKRGFDGRVAPAQQRASVDLSHVGAPTSRALAKVDSVPEVSVDTEEARGGAGGEERWPPMRCDRLPHTHTNIHPRRCVHTSRSRAAQHVAPT